MVHVTSRPICRMFYAEQTDLHLSIFNLRSHSLNHFLSDSVLTAVSVDHSDYLAYR